MAKKPRVSETSEKPQALTHNPFAALAGASRAATVKSAEPPAPVPPPKAPTPAPSAKAAAAPAPAHSKGDKSRGRVVLRRETKHRGGKAVVIVSGLSALRDFDEAAAEALAQQLKKQLGCGGTVEDTQGGREIVLQGDRAAQVAALLRKLGFRVDGVTT